MSSNGPIQLGAKTLKNKCTDRPASRRLPADCLSSGSMYTYLLLLRSPLALARKANFKSLHSPAVLPQPYSHSESAPSHSILSMFFNAAWSDRGVCPSVPVIPCPAVTLWPSWGPHVSTQPALHYSCAATGLTFLELYVFTRTLWRILLMVQHMFSWECRRLVVLLNNLWSAVELCLADRSRTFSLYYVTAGRIWI